MPSLRHHLTYIPMAPTPGPDAITAHLDALADEGWEPFHLQEVKVDGKDCLMVVSRRRG